VVLSTNVLFGVQSVYEKEKGLTGMYYDYAMAAPYMTGIHDKDKIDILILGMGTGTYATQCKRYFDNVNISGVEIDEKITELAVEYFQLPEDVDVVTYDGRAYLNAIEGSYDVIMVDAYQDITIPFQMSTVEFFELVSEHLKDDGVMVTNMNMRGESEGNINQYLADTISKSFSHVYTVDVTGSTNRELFASNNEKVMETFIENINKEEDKELSATMNMVYENLIQYKPGDYVMTDDKAPVELLGVKVIDEVIKKEVEYYRNIYDEKGISGIIDMMK
jgi:spermidine synthase